ncbi:hypothetical protein [Acetobacter conturbans]|uniref:Uncharacterized protein n=1 Tax=Acetobacter conturbans TaxID=1737472 RepID=A0ABX0K3U3_9PROT|nr:hypothetical protein [Acetobacter conturbans]NHN89305.1 hypothetical protein [Acetobacter conturbans]
MKQDPLWRRRLREGQPSCPDELIFRRALLEAVMSQLPVGFSPPLAFFMLLIAAPEGIPFWVCHGYDAALPLPKPDCCKGGSFRSQKGNGLY